MCAVKHLSGIFNNIAALFVSKGSIGNKLTEMKVLQNTRPICVTRILNNFVDKEVQSTLFPLDLVQNITFYPKYRIKNNFITPNSLISKSVSLIVALVLSLLLVYNTRMLYFHNDSAGATTFMRFTSYFDTCFYSSGFAMNFLIAAFQTKKSTQFVLTYQKVHRLLNAEGSLKDFIIWNWIIVIGAMGGHVVVVTVCCILFKLPYSLYYICYIVFMFDLNILYAIRVIKLMESQAVLWNIHVLNSQEMANICEKTYYIKVFQAYTGLLECYTIQKDCFQHFVSIFQFKYTRTGSCERDIVSFTKSFN